VALVGAAVVLGVVLPLILAATTGSLAIPHNDAWSYSRIAQVFARTGQIRLLGWNRPALFGQFLILGPLARWLEVQQVFVAVTAVAALLAIYDLLAPSIGRWRAAFASLVVAAWPGFGLLATAFMLDVPAMAAMMISLAFGRRALERRSAGLLITSVVFGLWGVTIREQALAAPVSVLLVAGLATWRGRGGFRWTVLAGAAAGLVAAVVAFEVWRNSFSGGDPPALSASHSWLPLATGALVRGYFILALGLLPAVLLVARPWRWRRGALLAAVLTLVVAAVAVHTYHVQGFFPGNYLDPSGPYWQAGNGRPAAIFPGDVWWLAVAAACGSGVLLAGLLVRRLPGTELLLRVFLVAILVGNLGTAITGQGIFDRYWLPLLPPLLAVILSERNSPEASDPARGPAWVLAAGTTACLLVLSLGVTAAGMAYDTARWSAASRLVAAGVPADDVDAGLEWNGYHSAIGMSPPGSWVFPGSKPCFTIAAAPHVGETATSIAIYRTFVITGTSRLWIYDNSLWVLSNALRGCPRYTGGHVSG
jgi:hypothetical protein